MLAELDALKWLQAQIAVFTLEESSYWILDITTVVAYAVRN
jgi:hypothetical protein